MDAPDTPPARLIMIETAISVAINGLIPTAIIWRVGLEPPTTILGVEGVLLTVLKATFLCVFLMTIALTFLVRARVAAGRAPHMPGLRQRYSWMPLIPKVLPIRAAAFALATFVVLAPLVTATVWGLALLPLGPAGFVAFNMMLGALMAIVATPIIVTAALADPVRGQAHQAV